MIRRLGIQLRDSSQCKKCDSGKQSTVQNEIRHASCPLGFSRVHDLLNLSAGTQNEFESVRVQSSTQFVIRSL